MKKLLLRFLVPTVLFFTAQLATAQSLPVISSISPSSALAGDPGFTVTVTGVNFVASTSGLTVIPGSQVLWNGAVRPTGFVSTTQLQASIPASDIASPGTASIAVANPGGMSNSVTFTISAGNPVPVIASLAPATASAGGPAFSLSVNGSNFVAGATVRWNGSDRTTTRTSSTQLVASISAADIASTGTADVSVFNPSPGGGGSGVLTFAIIAGGAARLEVLPTALNLQAGGSTPVSQTLRIGNSGGGFVSWSAQVSTTRGGNWLTISTSSGSAAGLLPSQVQVTANPNGLANGVYSGTITVRDTAAGNSVVVNVIFYVVPAAPILQVSHTGLRFSAAQGGVTTVPQSFTVLNSGPGTLNWTLETSTLSGGSWLSVSTTSGSSTAGTPFPVVTVSANPTGLAPGAYYGEIRVLSGAVNSPQSINVVLSVAAGGAVETQINPQGVLFVARAGSSAPLPQTVNIAGATALTATATVNTTSGGSWLDAQPRTLSAVAGSGGTLTLSASPGALPPGVYRGAVSLAFSDSTTQAISVLLLVASPAEAVPASNQWRSEGGSAATCVPLRLLAVTRLLGGNFTSPVGWPRTIEVQAVDDCGNLATGATIVASFSNGDPPLVLAGLGSGLYSATWRPGTSADQTTVTIRATQAALQEATLQVQGKVAANPGVPLVGSGGVVNAASFANGQPMAPGSIISVFGVRIADSTPGAASALPLPTTLAGASLVVGGVTAPLFYSSAGQINAQIPFEIPANTRLGVFVQLSIPGSLALSLPETIALDTARPGIFLAGADTQGVVVDPQGRLVNSSAPAAAGDIVVIYCTGLGATVPTAPTGRPAPSNPPATVITPVGVTVGGVAAADVQFAGLTPGLVGLYQVNVRIPAGVAAGAAVPLILTQQGVPSNTVTMAVR